MKRSQQVFLTLLIPAVAAFGCGQRAPAVRTLPAMAGNEDIVAREQPDKTDESEKNRTSPHYTTAIGHGGGGFHSGTGGATPHSSSVARGGFGGTGAHLSGGS